MSTRHFCDNCGNELLSNEFRGRMVDGRLGRANGGLMVQVITGWNGTWNDGEFCVHCIVQAVIDAANLECDIDVRAGVKHAIRVLVGKEPWL